MVQNPTSSKFGSKSPASRQAKLQACKPAAVPSNTNGLVSPILPLLSSPTMLLVRRSTAAVLPKRFPRTFGIRALSQGQDALPQKDDAVPKVGVV